MLYAGSENPRTRPAGARLIHFILHPSSFLAVVLLLLQIALTGCGSGVRHWVAAPEAPHHFYPGTWNAVDRELARGRRSGEVPAAWLVVRRGGAVVFSGGYGRTMPRRRDGRRVDGATLFDVASLTKPLAGAPLAVALWELDPEMHAPLAGAPPLGDLLRHTSGLADGVAAGALRARPGSPWRYANTNYLQIQALAEARLPDAGRGAVAEMAWRPMGLAGATFLPPAAGGSVAWCATDPRGQPRPGRPFDGMADFLAREGRWPMAHSGLFASAEQVAAFGEALMMGREGMAPRLGALLLGPPALLEVEGETGLPGDPAGHASPPRRWVSPGGMQSPTGPPWAPVATPPGRVFYQTGYTGCLLWIDSATGTTVALLTNAAAADGLDTWHSMATTIARTVAAGTQRGYRWNRTPTPGS